MGATSLPVDGSNGAGRASASEAGGCGFGVEGARFDFGEDGGGAGTVEGTHGPALQLDLNQAAHLRP